MTAHFDKGDPAYEWILHFLVRVPLLVLILIVTYRTDPRKGLDSVKRLSCQREKLKARMERREWT